MQHEACELLRVSTKEPTATRSNGSAEQRLGVSALAPAAPPPPAPRASQLARAREPPLPTESDRSSYNTSAAANGAAARYRAAAVGGPSSLEHPGAAAANAQAGRLINFGH